MIDLEHIAGQERLRKLTFILDRWMGRERQGGFVCVQKDKTTKEQKSKR